MSPVALIAAAGAGLFVLMNLGKKNGAPAPAPRPSTLPAGALPESLTTEVNQAIVSNNPDQILEALKKLLSATLADGTAAKEHSQVQMAISMLTNMLNQQKPVRDMAAGRGGRQYKLQISYVDPNTGTVVYDVFTPSGTKILQYTRQFDSEYNLYSSHNPNVDMGLVGNAIADFEIKRPPSKAA